jgi:hypothetical protein
MKIEVKSKQIVGNETVKLNNVLGVTISNLSTVQAKFKLNGIERILPPIDNTFNVPVAPFVISNEVYAFNLDLEFNNANSNIVIDYLQSTINQNQC